jgi:hypothetical protein
MFFEAFLSDQRTGSHFANRQDRSVSLERSPGWEARDQSLRTSLAVEVSSETLHPLEARGRGVLVDALAPETRGARSRRALLEFAGFGEIPGYHRSMHGTRFRGIPGTRDWHR